MTKKNTQHDINHEQISDILKIPFLGDLNSFFKEKNDTSLS